MKWAMLFVGLFLGCGADLSSSAIAEPGKDNTTVLTMGLYVESSDGKYIGEFAGLVEASDEHVEERSCVFIYNPSLDAFFEINLDTARPCSEIDIGFSTPDCTWSERMFSRLAPEWRHVVIKEDTGEMYIPTTKSGSVLIGSAYRHVSNKCDSLVDGTFTNPNDYLLENSGKLLDLGIGPIVLKPK
jgi:hypothetical protein